MQDTLRIEKDDTLFTDGRIGYQVSSRWHHGDSSEDAVSPDSQRIRIAADRHIQEIEKLHLDLVVASVVIVVLVLLLGYLWRQNRKLKKYFK